MGEESELVCVSKMSRTEQPTRLEDLERVEAELLDTLQNELPKRKATYTLLYLCGVARRTLAQSRAFKNCVQDQNGLVALALIRLQLDTVLRVYALYWVNDPHSFAQEVFEGKQIDKIKAADGQLMKDRYLIERLLPRNPWINDVYKNTSGLIHFSSRHIHASIRNKGTTEGEYEIFIGPNNPEHEYSDFEEMNSAFFHTTAMINVAVDYWFKHVEKTIP
ncbi:hypothetical protein [Rhizobium sp. C1]|uniref:hypothetical protein n=1 Tax=Rhizobium sp. C1 TaxID=1349799 RepID=UPI001E2B04E4|nr:hypothetical protein [Rhizobium sp. C1]MCD2177644.1 hypothetical protein [Rhizobium sp. C1]